MTELTFSGYTKVISSKFSMTTYSVIRRQLELKFLHEDNVRDLMLIALYNAQYISST
jgi:hypothetical protein